MMCFQPADEEVRMCARLISSSGGTKLTSILKSLQVGEFMVSGPVYVGDSEVDYQFAMNSNVNVIMASWGYRDKDYLRQLGNRVNIIDNPGELHDLL